MPICRTKQEYYIKVQYFNCYNSNFFNITSIKL
jgi:hypothetical protein